MITHAYHTHCAQRPEHVLQNQKGKYGGTSKVQVERSTVASIQCACHVLPPTLASVTVVWICTSRDAARWNFGTALATRSTPLCPLQWNLTCCCQHRACMVHHRVSMSQGPPGFMPAFDLGVSVPASLCVRAYCSVLRYEGCWPALHKDASGLVIVVHSESPTYEKELEHWCAATPDCGRRR